MLNAVAERIECAVFLIPGQNMMLDRALAERYGVSTRALSRAVKRHVDRFPGNFMFQPTAEAGALRLAVPRLEQLEETGSKKNEKGRRSRGR